MRWSFSGPAGCGKDTIGGQFDAVFKFASGLKTATSVATGIPVDILENFKNGLVESNDRKYLPPSIENEPADVIARKVRRVQQLIGDDVFRQEFAYDIWVHRLLKDVETHVRNRDGGHCLAVTDTRYPNEFYALKDAGFTMVYIMCPDRFLRRLPKHASENSIQEIALVGEFDIIIWNDRTLRPNELFDRCQIVEELQSSSSPKTGIFTKSAIGRPKDPNEYQRRVYENTFNRETLITLGLEGA